MLVKAIVFCCVVSTATAVTGFSDEALQPGTSGKDVVNNVNENLRRVFPDDHNFMDRVACVESRNGEDPRTYRSGYNGGIYQVDRIAYEDTKDIVSHPGLVNKHNMIMEEFGIDWMSSTWEDLRKPAYSGVASRLFISNNPEPIPRDEDSQAMYWKNNYNTEAGAGNPDQFGGKRQANLGSSNRDEEDFLNCPTCVCRSSQATVLPSFVLLYIMLFLNIVYIA